MPGNDFHRYEHLKNQKQHPNAKVCCVNIPDRYLPWKERTALFNKAISDAVSQAGERFFIADLFNSKLNNEFYYMNSVDGLHPDEIGAAVIFEVIEEAFLKFEG